MRCDLRGGLSSGFALILSLAACDPAICGRNSDCATGQICTAAGHCALAPDASSDAQPTDGGATTSDDAGATGIDASQIAADQRAATAEEPP